MESRGYTHNNSILGTILGTDAIINQSPEENSKD